LQHKQILVAGDDISGLAGYGQSKKLIVYCAGTINIPEDLHLEQ
jgi:hypothetical protein